MILFTALVVTSHVSLRQDRAAAAAQQQRPGALSLRRQRRVVQRRPAHHDPPLHLTAAAGTYMYMYLELLQQSCRLITLYADYFVVQMILLRISAFAGGDFILSVAAVSDEELCSLL